MSTGMIHSSKFSVHQGVLLHQMIGIPRFLPTNVILCNFSLLNLAPRKLTAAATAATASRELWRSGQAHLPTHAGTKYPVRGIHTPHSDKSMPEQ